ncbi:hypothetical protein RB195_018623 [Necator americanus]|uniref:Uncharacterized protein n=1 Tax=Necator americanus TaxID=51031 RepID=A0ABR1CCW4_NECAM
MGLERQSNLPGKWYNPAEHKWDNEERYHLTWQVSTLLTPEEQRKRKIRTLKLHLDYVVTRNIPQSNIRKSGAVWDVAFDNWTTLLDRYPALQTHQLISSSVSLEEILHPRVTKEASADLSIPEE